MELSFIRVRHYTQAMQLMQVRNECRDGMTHDTSVITVKQQEAFYFKHLAPHSGDGVYEAYLLIDGVEPIGYGLLKQDGPIYWMTAGLVEKVRGKGLSRLLINYITEMGHREGRDVWIDVYDDNAALYGDIRVGYEFVNQTVQDDGRILHVMRHERERVIGLREADWLVRHGRHAPLRMFRHEIVTQRDELTREMIEVDAISRESFPEPSYVPRTGDGRFIFEKFPGRGIL